MENGPSRNELPRNEAGEQSEDVNEALVEEIGETALRIKEQADDLKGEMASRAVDTMRGIYNSIIDMQNSASPSAVDLDSLGASFEKALDDAWNGGYLKEVSNALIGDDMFFEWDLFSYFEDKGVLNIHDVVKKCGSENIEIKGEAKYYASMEVYEMSEQKGELTDAQSEYLELLSRSGVNLLEAALSDEADENIKRDERERAGRHFYEQLKEHKLIRMNDVAGIYSELFNSFEENGKFVKAAAFLDSAMKDGYDGLSVSDEYWLTVISEKGVDGLVDFKSSINKSDMSVFDRYDFRQEPVKRAFFEVLRNSGTTDEFDNMVDKKVEDPSTREALLRVLDENAPEAGSTSKDSVLISYIVKNKDALDDLVRNGMFERYPRLRDYDVFQKISDGTFTERNRLQYLFGGFEDTIDDFGGLYIVPADDWFDEQGELMDGFYEAHTLRPDIFKALGKEEKLRAINVSLKRFDSLHFYRDIDAELLAEAGFSDAELCFIKIMNSTEREDLPYMLGCLGREGAKKYYDDDGLREEFFTDLMMGDEEAKSFLCRMSPSVLEEVGISSDEFAQIIRQQYDNHSLQCVELADLDDGIMQKAFGDDEALISYLHFLKAFSDYVPVKERDPFSSEPKYRSMMASYVDLANIDLYYKDGKATDAFVNNILSCVSLEEMRYFTPDVRSQLGIDRSAFLEMIKSRHYSSSRSVIDLCLFLGDDEIGEMFAGLEDIGDFFKFVNNNASRDKFRFITLDNIGDYFYSDSGPTDKLLFECARRGLIGVLNDISDEQKNRYDFSDSTKSLLLGCSSNAILNDEESEVNESNALALLARFLKMDANDWLDASDGDLRVKEAFSETNIKNKNLAMQMLRKEYEQYLKDGAMPIGLRLFTEYMRSCDGAGPLTQIEMFLDYCGELGQIEDNEMTKSISGIEKRIRKWGDQEKANYYSVSAEIMRADPAIYKEFLNVFDRISDEEDFGVFVKEIFPLYRAKLALLKKYNYDGDNVGNGITTANYSYIDKTKLMNDLHLALVPFSFEGHKSNESNADYRNRQKLGIERVKNNIFSEISGLFQEKFGILPEVITDALDRDAARSVEDMTLYLSNINDSDEEKKNLIGFFLALQLKKDESGRTGWDDLRAGRVVDPRMYLEPEAARSVIYALERSRQSNPITPENVGIASPERLEDFRVALQDETSEIRIGSVLAVDTKLQTISQNIIELMDPDLYDDPIDKAKIELLMHHESKLLTSVATKLWIRESGGNASFSAGETKIGKALEAMLVDNGLELTPENINKHLQRGFKDLGKIATAYRMIENSNISEVVSDLQSMLMPSDEVAKIFGELGEEFRPHSGVLALSADIEFLERIVAKADKMDRLSGSEAEKKQKIEVVRGYLEEVRKKFTQIDALYSEVVKKFENISIKDSEGQDNGGRRKLAEKLKEISDMVGQKIGGAQSTITTICSNSLPTIIENMRACLSCKTKGCNNDTNLTFGEGYKFYLYSSGSTRGVGSVSDEIVYFVPVGEGEDRRMSFVMDQVYGNKSSDIYLSHVATIMKKAKDLKRKFPEARISVFLTEASATSCGTLLNDELLDKMGISRQNDGRKRSVLKVDIPESGFGDHYIEIGEGDDARSSGPREIKGFEVVL